MAPRGDSRIAVGLWWHRLLRWFRRLKGRILALSPAADSFESRRPTQGQLNTLAPAIRAHLDALTGVKGAVRATVDGAVEDYLHLREVLLGPGASTHIFDDVEILASAEEALTCILEQAPELSALSSIASRRPRDRAGRAAAGEALLHLRDTGRKLHDTTAAALQWASSRSEADGRRLAERAGALSNL